MLANSILFLFFSILNGVQRLVDGIYDGVTALWFIFAGITFGIGMITVFMLTKK
jgi:hypothetical protein